MIWASDSCFFGAMINHPHLVVQVADVPLSTIVQNVTFRYIRWIYRRQRRTGHLFQGRYQVVVVAQFDS